MFHAYYQQLLDMCEILSEDENHFLPPECARQFSRLGNRVDRLYDHTQMLREYALQIREMQQAQIDLRQNDTMRILTVVSTIFFPAFPDRRLVRHEFLRICLSFLPRMRTSS